MKGNKVLFVTITCFALFCFFNAQAQEVEIISIVNERRVKSSEDVEISEADQGFFQVFINEISVENVNKTANTAKPLVLPHYSHKPEDIITVEEIFIDILNAKKQILPKGYAFNTRLIEDKNAGHLELFVSEECANKDYFFAELYRNEVKNKTQELVIFTCDLKDDNINFFRTGKDLQPLDSQNLVHLNADQLVRAGLLDIKVGESIKLRIVSKGLQFEYHKSHADRSRLIFSKKFPDGFTIEMDFWQIKQIKKKNTGLEYWWDYNISFGNSLDGFSSNRFLTISTEHPSYKGVFKHKRYFNEGKVGPIEYLARFEEVKIFLDLMFR